MKLNLPYFLSALAVISFSARAMDDCWSSDDDVVPYEISPKLKKKGALKKSGEYAREHSARTQEKPAHTNNVLAMLKQNVYALDTKKALEEFVNEIGEDSE